MRNLAREFVQAFRSLRRAPAFTLMAVLTLALGIGATTAIFSVVNAVLLRPLPYDDAGRLVVLWGDMRTREVYDFPFPPADYADIVEQGTLFEGVAAVFTFRQPLVTEDRAEQIRVGIGTTNVFSLLGARIVHGRDFLPSDGTPQPQPPPGDALPAQGAAAAPPPVPNAVILSHAFWQRRFGGDPDVLGRIIQLGGGGPAEIVGVVAPEFELLLPASTGLERQPDLWAAARIDFAAGSRINVFLRLIGRLKPGVTVEQAQAQADMIAADLRRRFPIKETSGLHFRVEPMHADLVADARPAILALMGAVVFVLLIAAANVGNLLLVRAWARERELAVRAALGSARWQLMRQLMVESLVLAAGGVLAGIALAWAGIRLLLALAPANLPRIDVVQIDGRVLGFAILAGVIAALAVGVLPALRASRPDVMDVLRASGRAGGSRRGTMVRNGVVVAEVALSLVLLIGSGLMLRSFVALQRADPGYRADGLLTFWMQNNRPTPDQRAAFALEVRERLGALPGVTGVTAAFPLPLDGAITNARWGPPEALTDGSLFQQANAHFVLPGYFEAMGTRLIEGRTFTEADNDPTLTYVVVDRHFAAKAFPGQSAVGQRLPIRVRTPEPEWFEVIGVVAHQRHETLVADGRETVYFTNGLAGHGIASRWAVRVSGDPARLAPSVRASIAELDPLVPIAEVQPMGELVDRAMAPTRFSLVLIGVFAVIAAALAAVGLYGVLATAVRQRTSEIGVRMAFGAPSSSIFRLVIGEGLRLGVIGVAIGAVAAIALTRVMTSMLVDVAPTDPVTFVAIPVLLCAIAALASWLPARRAAMMDPSTAIRGD
ncbi:MAG TPA: ABC transporter permease [Gemmatimonadaceae bacterium]|nr:ABC transporter permease [Gemmatimonadaceae bacterium]